MHHYFFLKFLMKKSWCILWAGKYGEFQTKTTSRYIQTFIILKHMSQSQTTAVTFNQFKETKDMQNFVSVP